MRKAPTTTVRKVFLGLISVAMLMAGFGLASAPSADAQAPTYFTDTLLPPGTPCPAGETDLGTINFGGTMQTLCRPTGGSAVWNQGLCEQGNGLWISQAGAGAGCSWAGFALSSGDTCDPPGFVYNGSIDGFTETTFCGLPLYATGAGGYTAVTPVCIESSAVQNNPAAAGLRTSSEFIGSDGIHYLITSGAPTCELNCYDGHDANCDGVLGDYCPIELDLDSVAGVADCLAFLSPAVEEAAPAAVPALHTGGGTPAPPAAHVAAGPQLAVSGTESGVLAYLGTGLVGFGVLALGMRRRMTQTDGLES